MTSLYAISAIDGRYRKNTEVLRDFFSEAALMKYRVIVEGEYFIALSQVPEIKLRPFTDEEIKIIRSLYALDAEDAELIKKIEKEGIEGVLATNHDVKAVEYFLKEKLKNTSLAPLLEWLHFAITSEDTNNIAYALMLRDSLEEVIVPALEEVEDSIEDLVKKYKGLSMLARTHGQSASPTTFGKEMFVFVVRLERQLAMLRNFSILAKINGATGNYNAHMAAFPKMDWVAFSSAFIDSLNGEHKVRLEPNIITTQIESHDTYVELFDTLRRANMILLDFSQDMWRYISDGWVGQKPKEGEVGSSTMPHKINPIDFENAEGNLGMANALARFFAEKLPVSRLQRDLSDSTVERNFGTMFAHSLMGYQSLLKGLGKILVNEERIKGALAKHPEVLAEAIQTILRRDGIPMPYEQLKDLTRGKEVTMEILHDFIKKLSVSEELKKELLAFTPEKYIGKAVELCER